MKPFCRRVGAWPVVAMLAVLGLGWPGAGRALEPALRLSQAHHTAWRGDDGAPANVVAMAQTPDGYLWLGTGGGLVRFDGVRFDRVASSSPRALLSGSVTALQATREGELLVGHRFGGVGVIDAAGTLRPMPGEGMPAGNCWAFAVDGAGDAWGAFTGGVARWHGGRWHPHALDGEPVPFRTLVLDAEGHLWATAKTGAYVLPAGSAAFQRVDADLPSFPFLSVAPDGRVWAADFDRQRLVALGRAGGRFGAVAGLAPLSLPPTADRHWFDAHGGLWLRTGAGAMRAARPGEGPIAASGERLPSFEAFGARQGLTGDLLSFLEDREGNVWLGTAGGLHRLRQAHVTRVALGAEDGDEAGAGAGAGDGSVGVAPAAGGGVWATTDFGGLFRVGDAVRSYAPVGERASHLHRGSDGVLWVGSRSALWRVEPNGTATEVPRPDAGDARRGAEFAPVHAMARDRSGALWAHLVVKGTFRLADGRWQRVDEATGARIMSMGNDADGRLWLGYIDRGAARVDGGETLAFGPADGLDIGAVTAIHGRGPRVWLGGQRGVALHERGTMKTLAWPGLDDLEVVTGIVETAAGDLWINAARGLTHLAAGEWRRAVDDPAYRPRFERFDGHDGLMGSASQIRPLPSLVEAEDGRLWAALPSGLFTLDPARLRRNALPPAVIVQALAVDGERAPAGAPRPMPAGRADLRFEYTATSLTVPQRVRFRYRLEGYDDAWQDAGGRREAAYTRVGPGHYRFRVVASNNDGVWNEEGASLDVTVPPAFWQTRGFAVLLAGLAGAGLWLLYRLRIRQISRRLHGQMDARLRERERIARELHDTLLQGVTGLTLHVRAVANQVPDGSPLRGRLELALRRAQELIVEGRDRVAELRVPKSLRVALSAALADACRELSDAFAGGPACTLSVEGEEREINPLVADEAGRIAREAMANALRHSGGRKVAVRLRFGRDALCLTVADDGHGFDGGTATMAGRPGHFGLTGMQERAARIGARLRVRTGARGTQVELRVPAAVAYQAGASGAD